MNYKYIKGDIFKRKNCYYAHCISRDYALGAGIAVEFNKRYNMSNISNENLKESRKLKRKFKNIPNMIFWSEDIIKINQILQMEDYEKIR